MTVGVADPAVREALSRALTEVRPAMLQIAVALDEVLEREAPPYPNRDREQFHNAFTMLMRDALEERGDETRRFVIETAVPAMISSGRTALSLLEGQVAFFTVLSHRLLETTPPELRDGAALWLARYAAAFVRDVTEAAQRAAEGT